MKRVFSTLALSLTFVMTMSLSGCSFSNNSAQKSNTSTKNGHIKDVTAITEVFGDGQKVTAAAVEYDKNIDNSKLTNSTFSVDGRTITKVYANNSAAKASEGKNGKYVIIELSTDDKTAYTLPQMDSNAGGAAGSSLSASNGQGAGSGPSGAPSMGSNTNNGSAPGGAPSTGTNTNDGNVSNSGNGPTGGNGPAGGNSLDSKATIKVSVTQAQNVVTTDGATYTPTSTTVANDKSINLVVDDFKQLVFTDSKFNNETLMYNLYTPKNYDKNKSYPMVLFMPDATGESSNPIRTLIQGNGGIIWATQSEQAKHESFVLCPQYNNTANDVDITADLVNYVASQYSIDKNRLYTTGQSAGCIRSISLDAKYPNLFSASYLVAGQSEIADMSPLAKQNIWIVVSEGDERAYPGMNAITSTVEKNGAKVSRAVWNGRADAAEFSTDVNKMLAENSNIKYTMLKKGTVVSTGLADNALWNHMCTWRIAYNIEGIRDWLFTQHK